MSSEIELSYRGASVCQMLRCFLCMVRGRSLVLVACRVDWMITDVKMMEPGVARVDIYDYILRSARGNGSEVEQRGRQSLAAYRGYLGRQ